MGTVRAGGGQKAFESDEGTKIMGDFTTSLKIRVQFYAILEFNYGRARGGRELEHRDDARPACASARRIFHRARSTVKAGVL